jgi:putative ABC transport system permease protein
MSIAKALGATNKRLIFSYLFQSLYLGIVSGVIGSVIGVVINRVFVDILNASDRYNIKFAFHLNELIEFSLLAIFIMIVSTFIAVSTTYKLKLTSRLQAD